MPSKAPVARRKLAPRPASITDLPFVADIKIGPRRKSRCFWNVSPIQDYGQANDLGRQFACAYLQYLKHKPTWAGSGHLSWIVSDMARVEAGSASRGYAVGFWAFLEQLLYLAITHTDPYALAADDASPRAQRSHRSDS